jgi:hypothetical protein
MLNGWYDTCHHCRYVVSSLWENCSLYRREQLNPTIISCKIKAGQEQWWFAQEKTASVTHLDITVPQYNPNHLPWLGYNTASATERFRSECNETWSYAFLFHLFKNHWWNCAKGKVDGRANSAEQAILVFYKGRQASMKFCYALKDPI